MDEANEMPTLISGVNWLGDSVMTMPAIHELKRRQPSIRIAMLVKPSLASLWKLNSDVDHVIELSEGLPGAIRTARTIRQMKCGRAFVLTQSFRSALVPFLAGVPVRTGMPGHFRDWMLTEVVRPVPTETRYHQMFEYFDLMNIHDVSMPSLPTLPLPKELQASCRKTITVHLPDVDCQRLIGMLPGAAHGPSKRWPASYFAQVAGKLASEYRCKIAVFGSNSEKDACSMVSAAAGKSGVDFSGRTSLPELATMLSLCRTVVANDSGGMHLSALVRTPVVAIFGLTDPAKTGPIGTGHCIVTAKEPIQDRDLRPESPEATVALNTIDPEIVLQAVLDILAR